MADNAPPPPRRANDNASGVGVVTELAGRLERIGLVAMSPAEGVARAPRESVA